MTKRILSQALNSFHGNGFTLYPCKLDKRRLHILGWEQLVAFSLFTKDAARQLQSCPELGLTHLPPPAP